MLLSGDGCTRDEVEVYGQGDPAKNIALNRPADQSSVSEWSKAKFQPEYGLTYSLDQVIERGPSLAEQRRCRGLDVGAMTVNLDKIAAQRQASLAPADSPERRDLYRLSAKLSEVRCRPENSAGIIAHRRA